VNRRRVCFYAPYLYPVATGAIEQAGGAEVQQWMLAGGLLRRGYEVAVVVCDYGQPRRVVHQGVELVRAFRPDAGLPVLRFLHPRLSLAAHALRQADAEVYVVRGAALGAGITYDVARGMRRRFVFMAAHDADVERALPLLPNPRDRWWYQRALRGADAVVVQTEHQRERLRNEFGLAAAVLTNPVELPAVAVDAGRDGTVIWLGTYKAAKRPEWFIELARRLPRRRFVMCGEIPPPPLTREVWEAASAAGRELANLEVRGFVPRERLGELFGSGALFVHTSPAEGFPNTVLEAWAHGLPTVTAVDPDGLVRRERLGDVVATFEDLVAAVDRRMSDLEGRRETGARARAWCASHHDPDVFAGQLAGILDAVIDRGRRR